MVRAGRTHFDGKRLMADTRRGSLTIDRGSIDGPRIQWRAEQASTAELVLKPAETASFRTVPASPQTFLVEWQDSSGNHREFFWFQDPLLKGPSDFTSATDALNASMRLARPSPSDISEMEVDFRGAGSDPAALMSPPSEEAPASQPGHNSSLQGNAAQLAAVLSAMGAGGAAGSLGGTLGASGSLGGNSAPDPRTLAQMLAAAVQQPQVAPGPSLAKVLSTPALQERLAALTQDEDVAQLVQQLPEAHQSSPNPRDQIHRALGSAPMRQQMEAFAEALQRGQLDPSHYGLQADGFSAEDFLRAIQRQADQAKQAQ